jgi:alanine-glyoxylate transaminase/serine-glyoxylate transaminase/serine-pyruvate transaminase
LEFVWGTPVIPETVEKKIRQNHYNIVAVVHAETSTGVMNPVAEIGAMLKALDTLYLVDTVTSLGGIEVRMDDWNIDALYSGTQKCLSCPPGLAPLSFSEKAVARHRFLIGISIFPSLPITGTVSGSIIIRPP